MKKSTPVLVAVMAFILFLSGCSSLPNQSSQSEDVDMEDEVNVNSDEILKFAQEGDKLILNCQFDSPKISLNDDGTSNVIIAGLGNTFERAGLPFFTAKLVLPKDTDIDTVSATWGEKSVLENIILSENEYQTTVDSASEDKSSTTSKDGFKASAFVQEFAGILVAYVTILPVSYQQEDASIFYCNDVIITLGLKDSAWNISRPLLPEDISELESIVDNPDAISSY